ncbi:MAG: tetratricopeptide repeat protein [Deltaproteobacteria bacterium]|nr:tetratricopeptide repeat protein [Deltaproteobacteria bacterium]
MSIIRFFLAWCMLTPFVLICACAPVPPASISASSPYPDESKEQKPVSKASLDQLPRAAAYYYFMLSNLSLAAGKAQLGLEYLNTARQIDPESAFLEGELAYYYLRGGQSAEALKHARSAVAKNPDYRPARLLLAGFLKAMKRHEEAIAEYKTILEKDPDAYEVLMRLGMIYMDLRRYEQAEKVLTHLLEIKPESHFAIFYLGRIALARKEVVRAEERFLEALKIAPEFEPAFSNLVILYEKDEKPEKLEELEKVYQKLIRLKPSANQARILMARLYLKFGREKQAQELFDELKAEALNPKDIGLRIGLVYFERGQFEKAIKELRLVLESDPDNVRARYYLSLAYEETEEYQKAVEGFLFFKPESDFFVEARLHLAYAMSELDDLKAAIQYIKEAIEHKPKQSVLYRSLATLYEENEQLDLAKETVEKGLRMDPQNLGLNFRLGVILDKFKDKEGSIRQMKGVIELDPEHADAMNYLAYTWAEMGSNLDEALMLVQKAAKIKPNAGYIIDTIGWIYFQQGIFPSALEHLKRAAELMPEDPVIHEHLGDTYFKLEQFQKAFEVYLEVQKLGPEDKDRLEKKIRDLKGLLP